VKESAPGGCPRGERPLTAEEVLLCCQGGSVTTQGVNHTKVELHSLEREHIVGLFAAVALREIPSMID
jgi:hypothetical protein